MRSWGIAVAATIVIACIACGSFGTSDSPEPAADAGVEALEKPQLTFKCGPTNNCTAGTQACCGVNGAFGCYGLPAGCPTVAGADAGGGDAGPAPTPGPSFLCTSYLNCTPGQECCYQPTTGSACADRCADGAASLCQLPTDGCGKDAECRPLEPPPPLLDVGECKYTGGGSSGGGSSGWQGGPWRQ